MIREALETGEAAFEAGGTYADGAPIVVHLRKRGTRVDIDDDGAGVRAAGTPFGWFPVAERVVDEFALNVNRAGVVFVQVREHRDLEELAERVAAASRAVHAELLELD